MDPSESKENEQNSEEIWQLLVSMKGLYHALIVMVANGATEPKKSFEFVHPKVDTGDDAFSELFALLEAEKNLAQEKLEYAEFRMNKHNRLIEAHAKLDPLFGQCHTLLEQNIHITDKSTPFKSNLSTEMNSKWILEHLIVGYIKQEFETKYSLEIPFVLKMVCKRFYGNIMMTSNILNINQMNSIEYIVNSRLDPFILNPSYYKPLFFEKICDSETDGLNAKTFDSKYGTNYVKNTLFVIKTKGGHIFSCYYTSVQDKEHRNSFFLGTVSCLLQSPAVYTPFYHRSFDTYHLPNNFAPNKQSKLYQITTKWDSKWDDRITCNINDFKDIDKKLEISEFEVFSHTHITRSKRVNTKNGFKIV